LVGGMPLAIDLAASWVRVLSCEEIARNIEHGLDILTTTWRDVPERHRSIRAILDHSWKLLSETERAVFSRLTVFSGGFEREAAADIAGASLTDLLDLIDKALLRRTTSGRFVIHELLKQYGRDRLRRSGDDPTQTRLRHCRYYTGYLHEHMDAPDAS